MVSTRIYCLGCPFMEQNIDVLRKTQNRPIYHATLSEIMQDPSEDAETACVSSALQMRDQTRPLCSLRDASIVCVCLPIFHTRTSPSIPPVMMRPLSLVTLVRAKNMNSMPFSTKWIKHRLNTVSQTPQTQMLIMFSENLNTSLPNNNTTCWTHAHRMPNNSENCVTTVHKAMPWFRRKTASWFWRRVMCWFEEGQCIAFENYNNGQNPKLCKHSAGHRENTSKPPKHRPDWKQTAPEQQLCSQMPPRAPQTQLNTENREQPPNTP